MEECSELDLWSADLSQCVREVAQCSLACSPDFVVLAKTQLEVFVLELGRLEVQNVVALFLVKLLHGTFGSIQLLVEEVLESPQFVAGGGSSCSRLP